MIKFDWPHTTQFEKLPCAWCGEMVSQKQSQYNKDKWSPESKYWNPEHREIYCGAEHSFQIHEERRCMIS